MGLLSAGRGPHIEHQLLYDVTAAQSNVAIMQLVALAALAVGVTVGYLVGPVIKKR